MNKFGFQWPPIWTVTTSLTPRQRGCVWGMTGVEYPASTLTVFQAKDRTITIPPQLHHLEMGCHLYVQLLSPLIQTLSTNSRLEKMLYLIVELRVQRRSSFLWNKSSSRDIGQEYGQPFVLPPPSSLSSPS